MRMVISLVVQRLFLAFSEFKLKHRSGPQVMGGYSHPRSALSYVIPPLQKRNLNPFLVYLIRQAVDEVRHRSLIGGGNELILVKRGVLAGRQPE